MADTVNVKISELPAASTPGNSDVLAGVQSSTTKKFTLSDLKTFFQNGLVPTSRKVNNKALSADISLDKTDIGLSNVANVLQYSASNKPTATNVTFNDAALGGYTASNVQAAVDVVFTVCQKRIDRGTISFSLSWSGSGPYTQTVTVSSDSGRTVVMGDLISLQPTAAQLASLIADGVVALIIENNAGTLTAYALGTAPTTAMTIACTIEENDVE